MTPKNDEKPSGLNENDLADVNAGYTYDAMGRAVPDQTPKRAGKSQIFDWYGDD